MLISAAEAREAEREARAQRLKLAALLRANESKAGSASGVMQTRRVLAAAQERSATYDTLLAEQETQRLFSAGALYFAHPNEKASGA